MAENGSASREALESVGWTDAREEATRLARIEAEIERGFSAMHEVEPAALAAAVRDELRWPIEVAQDEQAVELPD